MKTQFKHHIKFGSCWYDNFFKTNTRQQIELQKQLVDIKNKKESATKKIKT